ncbi:MAG: class I SAM-dependent methyltransferase [Anaerolineae bacterium]|nr:class I SAM-dependent methyltransferase [Anaerolineae bacterium]
MSGNADADWVDHALSTHLADRLPLSRCLSLGCGKGRLERQLASLKAFVACDAYDIAEGSIEQARQAADAAGHRIRYSVGDLNSIQLGRASYDAVWAAGSVHHVANLEHLFGQVVDALKPGGLFFLNEYVGPSRFQFPPAQRQAIQACLDTLPPAYREITPAVIQAKPSTKNQLLPTRPLQRVLDKARDGDLFPAIARRLRLMRAARTGSGLEKSTANLPTARSVIAVDPSEAVRSAEIVPLLRQHFDILEYKPLGGTILQFLLADIAGNFQRDETGPRLLEMLFTIEDTLIDAGHLDSDFAYIVAAPKMPVGRAGMPTAVVRQQSLR